MEMLNENNNFYYVDAVRLLADKEYCIGTKIKKLNVLSDFPKLNKNSQQFSILIDLIGFLIHLE